MTIYRYTGDRPSGEHYPGIPARDLSDDDVAALPAAQGDLVRSGRLYRAEEAPEGEAAEAPAGASEAAPADATPAAAAEVLAPPAEEAPALTPAADAPAGDPATPIEWSPAPAAEAPHQDDQAGS